MKRIGIVGLSLVAAFAVTAGTASAQPTGDFAIFKACPVSTPGVVLCFVAQSSKGHFTVGSKKVTFKQLTVQGGETENEETGAETFVAPTNGEESLSRVPLTVPNGLKSVKTNTLPKNLKERWGIAKAQEGLGLTLTVELAGKPGISRSNLLSAEGTALEVPVRIHLTNSWRSPVDHTGLLGEECYIGSPEGTEPGPIIQHLTSGTTAPPEPFLPITGKVGQLEFNEEFTFVVVRKNLVVDNTYPVPTATGCGGVYSELIDPLVNTLFGLPAPAGQSVTEINGTLFNATSPAVVNSER
jgi:hypothetical protein